DDLVVDTEFTLALREDRRALASNTRLHGYQDPEIREPVNTFFVVVKVAPGRQAEALTASSAGQEAKEGTPDRCVWNACGQGAYFGSVVLQSCFWRASSQSFC